MSSFPAGKYEIQQQLRAQTWLAAGQTEAGRQSILLATTDSEIRRNMTDLLQSYPIDVVSVSQMKEIKLALAERDIAACFCGFWLVDGTYRDVVRHLKRQRTEVPVVIICAPTCPHECRDYLAALNIRAFDFICYPYRRSNVEKMLYAAIALRNQSTQTGAVQRGAASAAHSPDGSFRFSDPRRAS